MPKSTEQWERDAENAPVRTTVKVIVIAVAVVLVVGAGVWGLGTAFSWFKGQGDGYRQKNSAQNWITAQRGFHQQYNDIQAYASKITVARKDLTDYQKAHPSTGNGTPYDPVAQQAGNLQTTLSGLQQQCMTTVAQYNTDAESYLTQDWRDADLPSHMDAEACHG